MVRVGAERRRADRLHFLNGAHGYGVVTKSLHWLTAIAILGQFVVGYAMDFAAAHDRQEERLKAETDRLEQEAKDQGDAAEDRVQAEIERREDALDAEKHDQASAVFSDVITGDAFRDGFSLAELHVSLGLFIIALAAVRILWRRTTPLPPRAEHLSDRERRLEGRLEKLLLTLLIALPASGLLLVATSDDWLPVHVTTQVILLVAIAAHVGLVLTHTVVRRNRHLARML